MARDVDHSTPPWGGASSDAQDPPGGIPFFPLSKSATRACSRSRSTRREGALSVEAVATRAASEWTARVARSPAWVRVLRVLLVILVLHMLLVLRNVLVQKHRLLQVHCGC